MRLETRATGSIPDSRGINLYHADRDARLLFRHYLPEALFNHLEPVFERLGSLAGDHLDKLATTLLGSERGHTPTRGALLSAT
jgi:acyl-CoA dehydrogenase